MGFCRRFFWQWARRVSKKTGNLVTACAHGHTLQPRWTAGLWPPVLQVPPQAGMPGFERNHAYHCKMLAGVFLAARCNHDLSTLLRFPLLSREMESALSTLSQAHGEGPEVERHCEVKCAYQESMDTMTQLIIEHEFYAADYSTKSQPQAANLLQTLHDSLIRHSRFAAERGTSKQDASDSEKAQRLLQSLILATNRRLHKGMPSIHSHLLGRPNH